jgi:hypothetical protein
MTTASKATQQKQKFTSAGIFTCISTPKSTSTHSRSPCPFPSHPISPEEIKNLPHLQIKLLTLPNPITPPSTPGIIALRTRLVKLLQTVLLRQPVAAAGTLALRSDESVRADLVRTSVFAFHGVGRVSD